MIKAVIFDFNGTLFQDHDINEISWRKILEEITENKIDIDSFYSVYKSVHNYLCVKAAFEQINNPQPTEVLNEWAKKKEVYYQNYCLELKRNKLTNGAEELLDKLKAANYPIGLCTSSIIENVNFYYKNVNLGRWFSMDKTIYDNGLYIDKVTMYQDCAKKLGVDLKDIIVFEDSPKSIKEAIKAGCQNVVAVRRSDSIELPEIKQIINDFTEFDYSILNN